MALKGAEKLFQSAGIYTVSRILSSAVPFLMMPVLTRYLTPADYGIVAMFAAVLTFVNPFVGINAAGTIGVRYFSKEHIEMPRYVGTCLYVSLATLVLVALFFALFGSFVSRVTQFPAPWLWSVVLVAAGQLVVRIVMTFWQVEQRALAYGVFLNVQTLVNVALSVLFVIVLGRNWQGRIEAQVVTICCFAAIGLYILWRKGQVSMHYDRGYALDMVRFGLPLIPHEIGGIVIGQTDRFFITNMVGIGETGVYSVGYQVGGIIEILALSFNQAYSPWLFRKLRDGGDDFKRTLVKYTYAYMAGILLLAVGFAAIAPWLLSFFVGKAFGGSGVYTFWISIGFAFSGMYYMVCNYIFYAGKTSVLAAVTFATALLNVVFNYVLIKLNGPVGAAQASAIAFFISFVLTWILSARVYPMPWNLFRHREAQ